MKTPPKTKRVSYYIDLWPGWQDGKYKPCVNSAQSNQEGFRTFEIIVNLPFISDVTETIQAEVRDVEA